MWIECTSESWITVDITKRRRETVPHFRTANRKCTLPELSLFASYGGCSGSWRSELTSLWVCRVKCYQVSEIRRTTVSQGKVSKCYGWFVVQVVLSLRGTPLMFCSRLTTTTILHHRFQIASLCRRFHISSYVLQKHVHRMIWRHFVICNSCVAIL